MEKTFVEGELPRIATLLIKKIKDHIHRGALIVALHGELGAGKTTLTKVLLGELGATEGTRSPTFIIMKQIPIKWEEFTALIHIDAYRLKNGEEIARLGFNELAAVPQNLIIVEWPEQVADVLPSDTLHVYLSHKDELTRTMKID